MNLFTGLTTKQELSFFLAFALFNGYVLLEAAALALFYVTSRPRHGRVRTAAIWHVVAGVLFMLAIISTVWAAPAEKSFVNGDALFDPGDARFQKVLIGLLLFALPGMICMVVGAVQGGAQKRRLREQTLAAS